LQESITLRDGLEKNKGKLEMKKQNTQSDLENVSAGKKTVRTMFKNAGDAGGLAAVVEMTDKDIESTQVLLDILTVYQGDKVIPKFKKDKLEIYSKVI